VRPIEASDRAPSTAPVRPVNAAPQRPKTIEAPHGCGTNKNQSHIENQNQQDASKANVGEVIVENDDVPEAIASLQRVGVNIVSADLGLHAGRGRRLLHLELLEWATWVQYAETNGIANKTAFAASKVRLGFTVGDAFLISRSVLYASAKSYLLAPKSRSRRCSRRDLSRAQPTGRRSSHRSTPKAAKIYVRKRRVIPRRG
jgi:hypothetical protein